MDGMIDATLNMPVAPDVWERRQYPVKRLNSCISLAGSTSGSKYPPGNVKYMAEASNGNVDLQVHSAVTLITRIR
jgi:hypothetical protein